MILVAARLPPAPRVLTEAARLTGLSAIDVRTRLAGPLPRMLHVEADADRARMLGTQLDELGFGIIVCDPRAAPGDDERLLARGVTVRQNGVSVLDGLGNEEEISWSALALIQRGTRTTTVTEVTRKAERRLDLTRALLTGGLMLTKKIETKTTRTTSTRDNFLLLHRSDGAPDVMIHERGIDYRFLGVDLQPSSAANFERLVARLRAAAGRVPYDDRVNRPGFLTGWPVAAPAVVDMALWVVQLAHLRGLA